MERLKGMEALGVVFKRVSDGCEVIQCMLEFYKEMADVERSYALRMSKLCQSTNYTFHSNILTQWLGSEPFEEIGTLKHSWQKLGNELLKLASLHAEKAEAFHEGVRQPLQDILPELEEERKQLRQRKQDLENDLRNANRRFQKIKKNYFKVGDTLEQLKSTPASAKFPWPIQNHEKKLTDAEKEFKEQEKLYQQAHRDLQEVHKSLNEEIEALFADINNKELRRVETVSRSLKEFTRTLSNTAPAYLESMQSIVLSVEDINGNEDIESFIHSFPSLHKTPEVPQFELHSCSTPSPEIPEGSTWELPEADDEESEEVTKSICSQRTTPRKTETSQPENPYKRPPRLYSSSLSSGSNQKGIHDEKPPPSFPPRPHTITTPHPTTTQSSLAKNKSTTLPDPEPTPPKPVSTQSKPPPSLQTRLPTSHPATQSPVDKRSPALPVHKPHPPAKSKPVVNVVGAGKHNKTNNKTVLTRGEEPNETRKKTGASGGTRERVFTRHNKDEMLAQLMSKAQANNYYSLLGVSLDASKEEISKARREITAKLHPDHFTGDQEQKQSAEEKLVVINQAYHNVLLKDESRKLYDQMCRFREKYHCIVQQEQRGLEVAKVKLSSLHSNMKKARFPLALLEELQLSIKLIDILLE